MIRSGFDINTMSGILEEVAKQEDAIELWPDFWNEGEIACLFADSNTGKSIYAVQIGEHIYPAKSIFRKYISIF